MKAFRTISFALLLSGCLTVSTAASGRPCRLPDLNADEVSCGTKTNPYALIHSGASCEFSCGQNGADQIATCFDGSWSRDCSSVSQTSRRKKRFIILLILCLIFCPRPKPRDNTPPNLSCPPDITAVANAYQTYTRVAWVEPTAYDDKDGAIQPTRIGWGPGSLFSGISTIKYYARDRSKNMESCSFRVTVTVVQCKALSPISNGYFICFPGFDYRYGSHCSIGCYKGHELQGESKMKCLKNGQWSAATQSCRKVTCDSPPATVYPLTFKCSDGNNYRSVCTYTCSKGYDIPYGFSRVRICNANGEWEGSVPVCVDTEPPKIVGCPGISYGYANINSTFGTATWDEPYATDNHDLGIRVMKTGDISNGDTIEAGIYHVVYTAEDSAGNKAQPCKVKIVIKVLKCNVIYPTPHLKVTCPGGNKYGAECSFSCGVGSELNGTSVANCKKADNEMYATWTYGTQQPFCDVFERCLTTPNVPRYGALACDNWLGGKFCQLFCQNGYDLKPGFNFYQMLVCGEDGEWWPPNLLPLPDCIKTESTSLAILRMSTYYYFTGDCHDPSVQNEIKGEFITALKSSAFRDACIVHAKDCAIANVKVLCGLSKRSAELRIDFSVTLTLDKDDVEGSFSTTRNNIDDISKAAWSVLSNESILTSPNSSIEIKPLDFSRSDLELNCGNNSIPSYPTLSCVKCGPGTYFHHENGTCTQCPKGMYQPREGESECLQCPFRQTTLDIGSIAMSDCQDGCLPGTWSHNGLPPCSLCPSGKYSDTYSSENCTPCNGSKSTKAEGSKHASDCREFDLLLTNNTSAVSSKMMQQQNVTSAVITFFIHVESKLSLDISSKSEKVFGLTIGENVSLEYKRWEKIWNVTLVDSRWHFIRVDLKEQFTQILIDGDVTLNKSANNGFLKDLRDSEVLISGVGILSQLHIWSYKTYSDEEYDTMPIMCSSEKVGDILNWKQFEDEIGDDVFLQTPSECDDEDDCASSPCKHGDCKDEGKTYSCKCHQGFYGESCEKNIDDCLGNVCENNATCIDGQTDYTCACAEGFTGVLCEILMTDGGWSNWTDWTSCSRTCGNGTMQRTRKCNSPTPDNGGKICEGKHTEEIPCAEQEICPFCSILTAPENSTLECLTSFNGSLNCTLECDPGFDFDHTPKPYYVCGPETFFMWDFQSEDNVYNRLPFCSEITTTDKLSASYSALYRNLTCNTQSETKEIHDVILETVQNKIDGIACKRSGVCTLQHIQVSGCHVHDEEHSFMYAENPGFSVLFDCDAKSHGSDMCYVELNTAVGEINEMAANTSFELRIDADLFDISLNDTTAEGILQCPSGHIVVQFYCVPCTIGNFLRVDECSACSKGTYQNESGQLSCKKCPDGMTTLGEGSIDISECTAIPDHQPQENGIDKKVIIGLVSGCAVVLCFLLVVAMLEKKHDDIKVLAELASESKKVSDEVRLHSSSLNVVWLPLLSCIAISFS